MTHAGQPMAFFDGPGGTQVPDSVIDAVARYYRDSNANAGGAFATSERSDAIVAEAHRAMADFLGAAGPDEIAFGAKDLRALHRSVGQRVTVSSGGPPRSMLIVGRIGQNHYLTRRCNRRMRRRSRFVEPDRIQAHNVEDTEIGVRVETFDVTVPDLVDAFPGDRQERRILLHDGFGLVDQ